jgi:hypothetical protein
MTYCVDASMDAMETPVADSLVYRPLAPPRFRQLSASDHPVLPSRQLGKCPVVIASP